MASNWDKITQGEKDLTGGVVYVKEADKNQKKDHLEKIRAEIRGAIEGQENIEAEITTEKITKFNLDDLKISAGNSSEETRYYAAELAKTLKTYSDHERKSLVGLTLDFYKTKDKNLLAEFEKAEKRTLVAINNLKEIAAPPTVIDKHLELINQLLSITFFIENMKTIGENPNIGLVATEEYSLKMYDILGTLNQINSYFIDSGVSLGKAEKTEVFLDLIQ